MGATVATLQVDIALVAILKPEQIERYTILLKFFVSYVRLSYTDDRTVESDSIANQRKLIHDFVAEHPEIEIVAEKVDDGYSGVLFTRPAFVEMIELLNSGEADCVIVKDLSRFGREHIEVGRYLRRMFPEMGVRFPYVKLFQKIF